MDKADKQRYGILGLLCAIYVLSFFHRVCPAVISLDLSADLGVHPAELGLLSGSTMLAYGLMQLPSGLLADAIGGRKAIVLLSLLAGVATVVFAMSGSVSVMVGSRFLVGLGIAVTVPALALLAVWFPPHMYGRASSLLLCCGGLGGVLAAPPLVFLSDAFGWRSAILFFGVLTMGMAVVVWVLVSDAPKEPGLAPRPKKTATLGSVLLGVKEVFARPTFWPLALWQMCMAGSYFAMASLWWGPYLMQGGGLSKVETGFMLTAASLTLLISQPIMGYLSDVVFKARRIPVLLSTSVGMLASVSMVLFTGEMSGTLFFVQTVCFMIGATTTAPLVFTMVKETFPLHLVGTASGCLNMFYPIWAAIIQELYGLIYEASFAANGGNYAAAFESASWVIVINFIAACALAFFMKETHSKAAGAEGV